MASGKPIKTRLFFAVQAAFYGLLRLMPPTVASKAGDVIGRIAGRYFRISADERSLQNLATLRPELSHAERRRRINFMWGHIGRIFTEFACLQTFRHGDLVELAGAENLPPPGSPFVVAACHVGSWEVTSIALAIAGHDVAGTYQPQSNPVFSKVMMQERQKWGWIGLAPDAAPMRGAIRQLDRGGAVVIYIDEYMNRVVNAPSLGRDVPLDHNIQLTAKLAYRSDLPLIFAKSERIKGPRYRVTFSPVNTSGGVRPTVKALDAALEAAIRERPEQWFMLHALRF
jgi:lauroyl/myristoyl acyltransferase